MSLSSARLIFKKCDASDLEEYLRFGTNAEVMQFVTPRPPSRVRAIFRFKKALAINSRNDKLGYWLAYGKENGELIAYLKLVNIGKGLHEIGYLILPEYWRQNFGSELVCALVEYASSLEEVTGLVGIVQENNVASRRVLEKCGFEFMRSGRLGWAKADFLSLDISDKKS